eukprot:2904917-Pleurochrysis_carterae.AAC.2
MAPRTLPRRPQRTCRRPPRSAMAANLIDFIGGEMDLVFRIFFVTLGPAAMYICKTVSRTISAHPLIRRWQSVFATPDHLIRLWQRFATPEDDIDGPGPSRLAIDGLVIQKPWIPARAILLRSRLRFPESPFNERVLRFDDCERCGSGEDDLPRGRGCPLFKTLVESVDTSKVEELVFSDCSPQYIGRVTGITNKSALLHEKLPKIRALSINIQMVPIVNGKSKPYDIRGLFIDLTETTALYNVRFLNLTFPKITTNLTECYQRIMKSKLAMRVEELTMNFTINVMDYSRIEQVMPRMIEEERYLSSNPGQFQMLRKLTLVEFSGRISSGDFMNPVAAACLKTRAVRHLDWNVKNGGFPLRFMRHVEPRYLRTLDLSGGGTSDVVFHRFRRELSPSFWNKFKSLETVILRGGKRLSREEWLEMLLTR